MENSHPAQHFHYPDRKPVQLTPTTAVNLLRHRRDVHVHARQ